MPIHAYAAKEAGGRVEPFDFEPGPLRPHEVDISVTHCGVCHSDVHLLDNDWGFSRYPMVPGHEIVGTVRAKGAEVRDLDEGDRVGVGWESSACLRCEWCLKGEEQLCAARQNTCLHCPGGFADAFRVDARFAFPIPKVLSSAGAAPLLCGGITVYSPLQQYDVRPSMRVGVVGIGGLGHLALKFARAFGCEVTAFSHSSHKRAEAARLGAHHFVDAGSDAALAAAVESQDLLLVVPAKEVKWAALFDVLRPKGRMVTIGAPKGAMISLPPFALIGGEKSLSGSTIGPRWRMRQMLEFAARHGIEAEAEVFPMHRANDALDRVRGGEARYRVVLTHAAAS
jgi:alcohol/geraniol dehydrogenase (NADP+)